MNGPGPFLVSNAVTWHSGPSRAAGPGGDEVVFVSAAPGTLTGWTGASVRVHRTGTVVSAALEAGGLDPVGFPATAGDTISLTLSGAGGETRTFVTTVSLRRPPVIVRTSPPPQKRDVPLNASLVVVFSEPIDPAALTSGNFQLRTGGQVVAGQLAFANPERTIVQLTPAAPLAPGTEYELVLSSGIRDLEGSPLEATTVPFATAVPPSTLGYLQITTATTGSDFAPSAYGLSLDAGNEQPVAVSGSLLVPFLPGPHLIRLNVGSSCVLQGDNPRLASISSGDTARIAFAVGCAQGAQLSADLAFVRNGEIHLLEASGRVSRLTNTGPGILNHAPTWSPDGQWIAFSRSREVNGNPEWGLFVMKPDGANAVQLTTGRYDTDPAWSPDGGTIAFTRFANGSVGIFALDLGGGPIREILNRPGWDAQPSWSPDGRQLTFSSDWRAYDILFDLYAIEADGQNVRPLLEGPFFWPNNTFYHQSAWSPDGQKIAVVVCGYNWANCYPDNAYPQGSSIALVNPDGSGLQIVASAGGEAKPTWSGDGQTIVFSSAACYTCEPSLRFVRRDGSAAGLVLPNAHSPAFRP